MDHIQLLCMGLSLLFFVQVMGFVRRQQFRERQAFVWLMLAAGSVLVAISIPLLNRAADRAGIAYMPALVFVIAFYAVLTLLMLQAASASREQEKLKTVVQELAFLRQEVDELKLRKTEPPGEQATECHMGQDGDVNAGGLLREEGQAASYTASQDKRESSV